MRNRFLKLIAGSVLLGMLTACSSTIRKPQLHSPGTAPMQRFAAEQFDPYPPNDMGPEIVGGRPIDYQIQVPEVNRARMGMPIGPWRQASRY